MGVCPQDNGMGSCVNPLRTELAQLSVSTPFFQPCKGLAYTFPTDNEANSNGMCQMGHVGCEVLPNGRD